MSGFRASTVCCSARTSRVGRPNAPTAAKQYTPAGGRNCQCRFCRVLQPPEVRNMAEIAKMRRDPEYGNLDTMMILLNDLLKIS